MYAGSATRAMIRASIGVLFNSVYKCIASFCLVGDGRFEQSGWSKVEYYFACAKTCTYTEPFVILIAVPSTINSAHKCVLQQ